MKVERDDTDGYCHIIENGCSIAKSKSINMANRIAAMFGELDTAKHRLAALEAFARMTYDDHSHEDFILTEDCPICTEAARLGLTTEGK